MFLAKNFQWFRTKTTKILTNVVSPALNVSLKDKLMGKDFAILIDESTDVACKKILAVCVR